MFQVSNSMKKQFLILGVLSANVLSLGLAPASPIQAAPPETPSHSASLKYLPRPVQFACRVRSRRLGSARGGHVSSARSALRDLGSASWAMCSLRAGGGTAWSQFAQDAAEDREPFLSTLAATLSRSSGRSAASRQQTSALLQRARQDLAHLREQQSRVEGNGIISAFEARARYRRNWLQAQSAIGRLSRLVASMPDVAALQLARRTFSEIHDTVSAENR